MLVSEQMMKPVKLASGLYHDIFIKRNNAGELDMKISMPNIKPLLHFTGLSFPQPTKQQQQRR